MKDSYRSNGMSTDQRYLDIMPPPEKDIADSLIPLRFKNLIAVVGFFVVLTAASVGGYVHLIYRVSTLECNVTMLVDVTVYKADPRQPNCK